MTYMRDRTGRRLDAHSVRDVNPVYYLNAYENFFNSVVGGVQNVFVAAQATTATTTTGSTLAGATVLPLTSVTGIAAGCVLVTNAGTATQQIHRVASVAANNVTLTAAVTVALSNGATVAPLWTNVSHLTLDSVGGSKAFGYFVANAKDSAGAYIITGTSKTVVWLGDSWAAQAVIQFNTSLDTRLGATNVVDAGVAGNTLAAMLARFDTDVAPQLPHYVVIEYGVNDVYGSLTAESMAVTLEAVVSKVRALGAVPIVIGQVPLVDYPFTSQARQQEQKALLTDGKSYPALAGSGGDSRYLVSKRYGTSSQAVGTLSLDAVTTGDFNTFFGWHAGQFLTTGASNTGFGKEAGRSIITATACTYVGDGAGLTNTGGSSQTAVGMSALTLATGANMTAVGRFSFLSATTATDGTAIGFQSGRGLTTGPGNTLLGYGAGFDPNASAFPTTTATGQTLVGKQTGQGSATQRDYITCLGYRSTADAAGAVAIGTDSGGAGAAATTANEIALGTVNHFVKVRGRTETAASTTTTAGLRVAHGAAPTSPVDGDVWSTTAGLFIRVNGVTKTVTLT